MSEQKKPKFQEGDVVVLTSMYPDGSSPELFTDGTFYIGQQYEIINCYPIGNVEWNPSGIQYGLKNTGTWVCESMLTLASDYYASKEQQMNISIDNTKINVQTYAEQYGITLEQAHNEIQLWLFEHGCYWFSGTCDEVKNFSQLLFISDELQLTHGTGGYYFNNHKNKEIKFERNIVLTIKPEPDTISFNGKKYIKEEFLKAIQNLNVVTD